MLSCLHTRAIYCAKTLSEGLRAIGDSERYDSPLPGTARLTHQLDQVFSPRVHHSGIVGQGRVS